MNVCKEVVLTIRASQQKSDEEEADVIHLTTIGILHMLEEGFKLEYEDSSLSEMKGTKTMLEMQDGAIALERNGDYAMQWHFRKGRRFEGEYETPFGRLHMGLFPLDVRYDLKTSGGEVHLRYELDMNGSPVGLNELHIMVRENGPCPQ